ncbi:MAG: hypothetical protein AABX71_02315 [Nanoarchaeota archaeon]
MAKKFDEKLVERVDETVQAEGEQEAVQPDLKFKGTKYQLFRYVRLLRRREVKDFVDGASREDMYLCNVPPVFIID